MKFTMSFCLFCLFSFFLQAQPAWTWLEGNAYTPGYGMYGIKGVPDPSNAPGSRGGSVTWQDKEGNTWLFGGNGTSASGSGYLNDVWKFSANSGTWTWVSGSPTHNSSYYYGVKGVTSPNNQLRPRSNAARWVDGEGNVYIFGGAAYNNFLPTFGGYTYLNDLWKYSVSSNTWTWIGGDTLYPASTMNRSKYGLKGVASPQNFPGSRQGSATWVDSSGNFWLYGGIGNNSSVIGYLSDLWKYNVGTGMWTWMGGDTVSNMPGRYGQQGVYDPLNKPGGKYSATGWTDPQGDLWLFGGDGYAFLTFGGVNDLWRYRPSTGQWTWVSGDTVARSAGVYGVKGVPSANNKPGSRSGSIEWSDPQGNFWLFGGFGTGEYNDLWKFNPLTKEWTWINGDAGAVARKAVYGQLNTPSDSSKPASGTYSGGGFDRDGNFILRATATSWKYSPATNQWAWTGGDTAVYSNMYQLLDPPVYGTKGIAAPANNPPARQAGLTWRDPAGNFWLYGGIGYDTSTRTSQYPYLRSDLWKYNPVSRQWTWVNGDSLFNKPRNLGTLGVPADSTTPGGLVGATTWTDKEGNLWLFGGSNTQNPVSFSSNDVLGWLWKYNTSTNQWTWVSGGGTNSSASPYAVYTAQPGDTTTPHPGFRFNAAGWTDSSGNFWLFGGQGFAAYGLIYMGYGSYGKLNDLWKFTPSTRRWTFVSGDRTTYFTGDNSSVPSTYGTKGVPGSGAPGGRSNAASWVDGAGNFWLFGGKTDIIDLGSYSLVTKIQNDLWRFTPSTRLWAWMGGDNKLSQPGIYRTKGVPDTLSRPGARVLAASWTDQSDNLYLFGGNNDTINVPGNRYYNDLWKFTPSTQAWTWLGGDAQYNMPGAYGTQGVASPSVYPGARYGSMSWSDGSGNAWIFSGYGTPASGTRYLNDLMQFSLQAALPVVFSRFTAQRRDASVQLNWTTAQEQNSESFIVERSSDGILFLEIGRVAAVRNANHPSSYAFTDFVPVNGDNFYRIKEVDQDGKSMYTSVQQVSLEGVSAGFSLLTNPVQRQLTILFQLSAQQVLELEVRDMAGHQLMSRQTTVNKGNSQLQLPVNTLPPGTYILQIRSGSLSGARIFVKQ